MPRFEYLATAYRQASASDAAWIINFVAPAEELRLWAGIPRRSDHNLAGFQRAPDAARIQKAKDFFKQPANQSPTALIVGLHPGASTLNGPISVEGLDPLRRISPCRLIVSLDDRELAANELAASVKAQIEYRLDAISGDRPTAGLNAADSVVTVPDAVGQDEDEDDDDEVIDPVSDPDDDEDDDTSVDPEVELGRSILKDLLTHLNDLGWCEEHREELLDMAKPATIIDGQHRVEGAAALERDLPFAVCALYECSWPEQVFQFTVVNYTAKGIPDSFITANAALSLTSGELDALKSRLVQAGVRVTEYELMNVVQFDSRSPFFELVNLSDKSDPARIGYRTMIRIAKGWYDARHLCFQKVLPNLYPDIRGRGAKARRAARWKEQQWGEFFIPFWAVVRETYGTTPSHDEGHTLWEVGHSQLIVAIVLLELQEQFFRNLNAQDEEFFQVGEGGDPVQEMQVKLAKRARKFVEWFPPDFFATKWALTSLSTGAGRSALKAVLNDLVDTNGRYQYAKSALVTGKTT